MVGINIVVSFLFSYALDKFEGDHHDHTAVGINMGIGWIFWLALFTIIAPQFLTDEDKSQLFQKQYIGGTIFLFFITLISTILTSYIAAAIVLN